MTQQNAMSLTLNGSVTLMQSSWNMKSEELMDPILISIFFKSCSGEVVHLSGAQQGGIYCTDFMKYWALHGSLLKR